MNALVTGGGGFLGGAIVRRLVARGDRVRSLSRGRYPELDALGVEQFRGDVADAGAVDAAVAGCDVVFHVAAKAGVWGPCAEYRRANVVGTQNILAACRKHGVRRLVYTSSPSVVFDGRDMEGVDESAPYPDHYEAAYPKTKAEAERLVLAANGPDLATVALRPHLIWGPGDDHLVPRILARGRAGRLRRIGRADKRIDATYIDNAADAHLLAAARLAPGSPAAGKAYFIGNGEPIPIWDLVNGILAAGGVPPVTRTIPIWLAFTAGWLLETAYAVLRRRDEPPLTRFVVRELTTAHWFDLTAARRDLGYEPRVSIAEGLRRLGKAGEGAGMATSEVSGGSQKTADPRIVATPPAPNEPPAPAQPPFKDELVALRQEIIEAQKSQGEFLKWKLIAVAGVASVALGLPPGQPTPGRPFEVMWLLCLVPLACLYVDLISLHLIIRTIVIGAYLKKRGNDYENYVSTLRGGPDNPFGFEVFALYGSSAIFNAALIVLGVAFLFASGPAALNITLIIVGGLGVLFSVATGWWFNLKANKMSRQGKPAAPTS